MEEPKRLTDEQSIVQKIIAEIKNELMRGALKAGDKLPSEVELARRFTVSRTAVREAIKMLVALGVVQIKRGNGTYITTDVSSPIIDSLIFDLLLSRGAPRELFELRESLEIGILKIVLENATEEDICKMEKAVERLEEDSLKRETDGEILANHDLEFHHAFADATHNSLITKIAWTVWELFRPSIKESTEYDPNHAVQDHRMILDTIKKKDLEKLRDAMEAQLSDAAEKMRQDETSSSIGI